jgi:hypothetical protein
MAVIKNFEVSEKMLLPFVIPYVITWRTSNASKTKNLVSSPLMSPNENVRLRKDN